MTKHKLGGKLAGTGASAIIVLSLLGSAPASATGWHTCDSEPRSDWVAKETLEDQLTEQGWQVRRIKEDGNCWEVYAINSDGKRVEAYIHPITLEIEKIRVR
ncbi:MAG: PepSY domain-containing protein [Albidovulum sp.]|nr:PepSY domain-containing protein [Albidovulum sp.]